MPEYPNETNFEVIYTYFKGEQDILRFPIKGSSPSEAEALHDILGNISRKKRANLCKLSLCQLGGTKELPWLEKNNGKYYFDEFKMKM